MTPTKRIPTHPGVLLVSEFLEPKGISQVDLAAHLGVSVQRINGIVKGKRAVTPDTAWLLSMAFGTTPELWMNAQTAFDLATAKPKRKVGRIS